LAGLSFRAKASHLGQNWDFSSFGGVGGGGGPLAAIIRLRGGP